MTIELHQLLLFSGALAVLVATPGPFVAAVAARAAAQGFGVGFMMALGAAAAEIFYILLALLGLAAIAATHAWALEALRYIGAVWLIWIGAGLLFKRAEPLDPTAPVRRESGMRAFLTGALINLGNPKTALFYMAIFPGFFDMGAITTPDILVIVMVAFVIGMASDLTYVGAAVLLRRKLGGMSSVKRMQRMTGGVMVGAGVAIAAS